MRILEPMILRMMNRMLSGYDRAGPLKKRMVSAFMHHFPGQITCKEFGDFMGDYLDGELPEPTRERFEFHLMGCPMCRKHMAEYRAAVGLAKASSDERAPQVPQSLINAILAARPDDDDSA